MILNKRDYMPRLNGFLDDTSALKRFHIEEYKALNKIIYTEHHTIDLLKGLKN